MKSRYWLAFLSVLLFCGSFSVAQTRFSLVFNEGFGSIKVGYLNTALVLLNSIYDGLRDAEPGTVVGDYLPLPIRYKDWQAEIRWNFVQRHSLGIFVYGPSHFFQRNVLTDTFLVFSNKMRIFSGFYGPYNTEGKNESVSANFLRFSLSFFGQISSFAIGDPNNAIDSYNNNSYFEYLRTTHPGYISGGLETIPSSTKTLGIEIGYRLAKRWTCAVAMLGPVRLSNDSSITYSVMGDAGAQTTTLFERHVVDANLSVLLSIRNSVIISRLVNISALAGAGYYPGKYKLTRETDIQFPLGSHSQGVGTLDLSRSFPIGFHGGFDLSANLTNKLALVVETKWRIAKTGHLRGTAKGTSSSYDAGGNLVDTTSHQWSGILYSYSAEDLLIGSRYKILAVRETRPIEGGISSIRDIRKANLDLGGYSILVGLRIRLF